MTSRRMPTALGEETLEDLDVRQLDTDRLALEQLAGSVARVMVQGGVAKAFPTPSPPCHSLPSCPFPFSSVPLFCPRPHFYPRPFSLSFFSLHPCFYLGLAFSLFLSLFPASHPPPLSIGLPSSSQHRGLGWCSRSCFKFIAQ